MFLRELDVDRPVRCNDSNEKTRDHFVVGPELEIEWDEEREVVFIRRIVRPFGFAKTMAEDERLADPEKLAAAEAKARKAAPRKVLAIVPITTCQMWPLDE